METIKIQVEVGFSEAAATILRSILGSNSKPEAPAAPAMETKPSPEAVVREIKHEEPIQPEATAAYDGPVDDPTLRAVVSAAVKRVGRDTVAAHLKGYDWYKNASVDCPMERRAELITNLKAL